MTLSYRPEIDGLRAIAVTAVILFHGQVLPVPGGFAGVDVFFVLSGYLITAILLREVEAGEYSLWRFYERRIRRILPALAVVLLATSLAAWALMIPSQLEAYSETLLAVVLFISNLLFAANSGYFSPILEEAPLLHTWSLSVEEQFYLVFPLILAATLRRVPRALPYVIGAMALASLAIAEWGWRNEPDINFFFTLSRFWELLAGSAAALILRRRKLAPQGGLAALGLAMILGAMIWQDETTPYPSIHTLLPVGGTVLLVLFAQAGTLVAWILSLRVMVAVGLISYSAYLWHQPLFAFARITAQDAPSAPLMAGLTVLTYALAWASWAWVEQPFRRRDRRWMPQARGLFIAAGGAMVGMIALAAVGLATKGNDSGWRAANPTQAATLDLILASRKDAGLPADDGSCRVNFTSLDAAAVDRLRACAAAHGPAAVVLGDSHGVDVWKALHQTSRTPFLLGLTDGGCRPAEADPACPFDSFATLAAQEPQLFGPVLFVQSGAYLLVGPDGREGSRQLFTRASAHAALPDFPVNRLALDGIAAYLQRLTTAGLAVTWLSPRIEPHIPLNRVLRGGCEATYTMRPGQADAFAQVDAAVASAAARISVSHIALQAQPFAMETDFLTCQTFYWSDGDHWSTSGEALFGARLMPLLPQAFR